MGSALTLQDLDGSLNASRQAEFKKDK